MLQRFEQSRNVRSGEEDSAGHNGLREERCDEVERKFGRGVSDHHGVGIRAAHFGLAPFELVVQLLGVDLGLGLVGFWLSRVGQLWLAESLLVVFDIFGQCLNHSRYDRRRNDDASSYLMGASHTKQEVDDKFMVAVQDDRAGAEYSAGNVFRNQSTDLAVLNFLALDVWILLRIVVLWCVVRIFGRGEVEVVAHKSLRRLVREIAI